MVCVNRGGIVILGQARRGQDRHIPILVAFGQTEITVPSSCLEMFMVLQCLAYSWVCLEGARNPEQIKVFVTY